MREDGIVTFLLADHLGSTSVTTDSTGVLVSSKLYTAFGETRTSTGMTASDYLYTGQREESEIGLYFYHARFYDVALARFISADTIVPQPGDPLAWDRYSYVKNNPLSYTDPSGHCPICVILTLVIGTVVLTSDSPKISPPPTANGNASNLWDLLQLGIEHANSVKIVGRGLQDLQSDPHVKGAQDDIIEDIRSYPQYQKQPFEVPISKPEGFTANGPDENWVTGALTGNPSFWMVHTANLYATNTIVSEDGTISTTWIIEDQFDYLPAWDDHFRTGASYWAYNSFAQLIAPIYHGLLQAEPLSTKACWNQTHPPENKFNPK